MKQCPACRSTYTDDSLTYCLADGSKLIDALPEQETVVRNADTASHMAPTAPFTVDIAASRTQASGPPPAPAAPQRSSTFLKVMLVVVLLGIGLVAVLGVAGLMYFNTSWGVGGSNRNKAVMTPSPAPTKNDTDELRDKIADLEKRLSEQNAANKSADVPETIPTPRSTTTARVNSPGDGFLALRTLPSSDVGERILKIPHGATVTIGACGPVTKPVNRSGRWCQASYDGYTGWVFDAYLIYQGN